MCVCVFPSDLGATVCTSMGCGSLRWLLRSMRIWGIQTGTSYGHDRMQALRPRTPAWRRTRSAHTHRFNLKSHRESQILRVCVHVCVCVCVCVRACVCVCTCGRQLSAPGPGEGGVTEGLALVLQTGVQGKELTL